MDIYLLYLFIYFQAMIIIFMFIIKTSFPSPYYLFLEISRNYTTYGYRIHTCINIIKYDEICILLGNTLF